jgi:hypothetical protein
MTQAIRERPHHVRGKVRCLLNEKMEPSPVDSSQATRGLRDGGGSTRAVVNQCHLPNQCALPYRFEYEIAKQDLDFSLQQHVHVLALIAFPEKEIARPELQRIRFLTKKLRRIHECRDYKGRTTSAKLRLCDKGSLSPSSKFFVFFVGFMVNFCHSEQT